MLLLESRQRLGRDSSNPVRRSCANFLSCFGTNPLRESDHPEDWAILLRDRNVRTGCNRHGRWILVKTGTRTKGNFSNSNSMTSEHWFWWLLTAAALVWYSTVTIYVAFKGMLDIRQLLRRLKRGEGEP